MFQMEEPQEGKHSRRIHWTGKTGNSTATNSFTLDDNTLQETKGCVSPTPWYQTYPTWTYAPRRCKYCDGLACKEPEMCPRVKSVSYFKDGSISKIEFHKAE